MVVVDSFIQIPFALLLLFNPVRGFSLSIETLEGFSFFTVMDTGSVEVVLTV